MPQWRYLTDEEMSGMHLPEVHELPGLDLITHLGIYEVVRGTVSSLDGTHGDAPEGWFVYVLGPDKEDGTEPWRYVTVELRVLVSGHPADMTRGVHVALLTPEIVEKIRGWTVPGASGGAEGVGTAPGGQAGEG
jgi:hypothetical protein